MPEPKNGQDARQLLARTRKGLVTQNHRSENCEQWFEKVRRNASQSR